MPTSGASASVPDSRSTSLSASSNSAAPRHSSSRSLSTHCRKKSERAASCRSSGKERRVSSCHFHAPTLLRGDGCLSIVANRNQGNRPGVALFEPGLLGGPGVDGGDLGFWGHDAKAVGVADGQVVEAAPDGRILGDGEVGLEVRHVEGAAVHHAHSDSLVARLPCGEREGEVLLPCL